MPELRRLMEAVLDGANVLIATVDRELRYTFFNKAHHDTLLRITGKRTSLGMSLHEALADLPEERDRALAVWRRALSGETIVQKLEFGRANQYRRWYHTRHTPIFGTAGEVIGAGEVTTDITDMVLAESALHASEQRFTQVFTHNTAAMSLVRLSDGVLLEVNPAWLMMFGHQRAAVIGRTAAELQLWIDANFDESELFDRLRAGKAVRDMELPFRLQSGQLGVQLLSADLITLSGEAVMLTSAVDITERKWSEHQLAANHATMTWLHRLSTMFLSNESMESILAEVVKAAIAVSQADFGNLQLVSAGGDLRIVAQHGFPPWWLAFWDRVAKGQGVCGSALETGQRVIVDDVERSTLFVGTPALEIQRAAGVRAVQSTPLVSQSGRLVGIVSTHFRSVRQPDEQALRMLDVLARMTADLIEQNQTRDALRTSEEENRVLFDSIPDAAFSTDMEYRVVTWNAASERMYGWSAAEAIGQHAAAVTVPVFVLRPASAVRQVLHETGEWKDEIINHRRDGSAFPVFASARQIKDSTGRLKGYVAINRDISDYRRAEQWLGFTTEVLARVIDGVIVLTADEGRVVYTNAAFTAMSGYQQGELLGQPLAALIAAEADLASVSEAAILQSLQATGRWQGDLPARCKGDTTLWTNCTISAVDTSPWGRVWLVIQRDISERMRAEEQRVSTLERNRDMLVREVHHRIKNHLHGVLGLMHMQLGRRPDLSSALAEVISQIKAIAEVYGLQSKVGSLGVDLGRIIGLIVRGAIGPMPVQYRPPDLPTFLLANADSVPISLIINELLTNAVKHVSKVDPARPVQVTLAAGGQRVTIRIVSGEAWLPQDFDFAARRGIGVGLDLVATLLPRQGALLQISQVGDSVSAELTLSSPVIMSG